MKGKKSLCGEFCNCYCQNFVVIVFSPKIVRFQNGSNKVAIEIILVISNRTRATRSFDFEITRMVSDQIALHSVQLPLWISLNLKPHHLPEHYRFVCYRSDKNREQHHHDKKCKSDVCLAPRLRLAVAFYSWAFAWIALWVDTATVCKFLVKNGNFNSKLFCCITDYFNLNTTYTANPKLTHLYFLRKEL